MPSAKAAVVESRRECCKIKCAPGHSCRLEAGVRRCWERNLAIFPNFSGSGGPAFDTTFPTGVLLWHVLTHWYNLRHAPVAHIPPLRRRLPFRNSNTLHDRPHQFTEIRCCQMSRLITTVVEARIPRFRQHACLPERHLSQVTPFFSCPFCFLSTPW